MRHLCGVPPARVWIVLRVPWEARLPCPILREAPVHSVAKAIQVTPRKNQDDDDGGRCRWGIGECFWGSGGK